jgi:hypothetical protein
MKLKPAYCKIADMNKYYNPEIAHDVMGYMTGARTSNNIGLGTSKILKMFTTDRIRKFVEIAALVGISPESIRQHLATLEPNYGAWGLRPVMSYLKFFWDATRLTFKENNVRMCDIREYLTISPDSRYYDPHMVYLDGSEDDVLAYFGLADYSTIQRKNKSLHGKIGGKIMDYFDDKTRRIIPSDYIKLFVHLDTQIQEQESQDKGMEAYRKELQRIFDRVEYVKDAYRTMDELNEIYITKDPRIETDEPYIKDEEGK